ncbi:hypothetical protein [Cellulophaga baltica]|uniref:hypothetical protein n=1 Tax=Cellulophaga baltica TaxID=76594 RepID=UPI0024952498|nr:hypothetical protein [Cellulophaga baltica]
MKKYNAVVAYSIKRDGNDRGRLVIVHYDNENISDKEIIELADKKLIEDSTYLNFTIESEGSIRTRNIVNQIPK